MWEDSSAMLLNVGEEEMQTFKEILLDVLNGGNTLMIIMWEKHLDEV
jgi:hypothetical protein